MIASLIGRCNPPVLSAAKNPNKFKVLRVRENSFYGKYFYLLYFLYLTEVVNGWTLVTLGDAMLGEAGRPLLFRLDGGDHGGATISPTSSSHRLDTRRRLFALLHSSSGSLSRSARSDSSELSPSRSSSTEKVKRWRGTDKFCL